VLEEIPRAKNARQVVAPSSCSLSFINLDQDTRLTIRVGGENFFLLCGKGGVSGD